MKFNFLIKAIPLISTLLLMIILGLSNQKEYTKLRILIWNTPTLELGSYLIISSGSGFIISYFITASIGRLYQSKQNQSLKYKSEYEHEEINEKIDKDIYQQYNNTLIQRDVNEPSPTINANFRIIEKPHRPNIDYNNIKYSESDKYEEQDNELPNQYDVKNNLNSVSNDWNDESFTSW